MKLFRIVVALVLGTIVTNGAALAQGEMKGMSDDSAFQVGKITLAATNVDAMVDFYGNVFGIEFLTMDVNGLTLYSGRLAGMNLLLCPNELANVVAEQNRTQFDFIVQDLAAVKKKALAHGGKIKPGQGDVQAGFITIIDPDNNTIVFMASPK